MRIISGKLRGRTLLPPNNSHVRPTTDRAKEALFNILSHKWDLEHIIALDLFCGTGNITYEFASRGALEVEAVESHFNCVRYIQKTLEKFELTQQCKVYQEDVFSFLRKNPTKAYDLIFADPPYDFSDEKLQRLINLLLYEKSWIKQTGCFILEHSGKWTVPNMPSYFHYTKRYGRVHLSFFEKE